MKELVLFINLSRQFCITNNTDGNPFSPQLHYTHNKNLVNEENQEISNHFQRRRSMARRINRLASGGVAGVGFIYIYIC